MSQRTRIGFYVAFGVFLIAVRVAIAVASQHAPSWVALLLNLGVIVIGIVVIIDVFRRFREK